MKQTDDLPFLCGKGAEPIWKRFQSQSSFPKRVIVESLRKT